MKAPKGKISTYAELRFKDDDEKTHVPDGAIVVERGKKRWGCLVEIKTGGMRLEAEQVSRYLDMAREHGFDGLLTISNQIRSDPKVLPRLAREGLLDCSIRVPDAVGPIGVEANLRTRRVTTTVEIPAPREGRPRTRVNWLLRQLKDAPDELRIDVRFRHVHSTRSELLRDCREAAERLLITDEPKREPRAFVLALSKQMGKKGGRKDGSFAAETRRQTTDFYRDLVQGLVPPRTKAPKIRGDEEKPSKPDIAPAPSREKSEGQARREHESSVQRFAAVTPFLPQ